MPAEICFSITKLEDAHKSAYLRQVK